VQLGGDTFDPVVCGRVTDAAQSASTIYFTSTGWQIPDTMV
jgi:hypothetical protein